MKWNHEVIIEIIRMGLKEDLGSGDITTDSVVPNEHISEAYVTAKEDGVIAGLPLAKMIFKYIDPELDFDFLIQDGDSVKYGDHMAKITGSTQSILKGERLVLNFLQRLSGIATKTAYYKSLITHPGVNKPVRIVDTRKTTPGLRVLEKYAVKVGGGHNHRMGLFDAVMIKDNHIEAAGGIIPAVKKAREAIPHTMKIEVEIEDFDGLKEALEAGADIIMLDNMSPEKMKEAVRIVAGRAIVEASGNITDQNIQAVAETGIDVISMGTLTHTIRSLDISLNISPQKIDNFADKKNIGESGRH